MRVRNFVCVVLVVFTMLFTAMTVPAQQITGNIHGTILDPSGAMVETAVVSAKQIETGLTRTAPTDRSGNYLLVELPVGRVVTRNGSRNHKLFRQPPEPGWKPQWPAYPPGVVQRKSLPTTATRSTRTLSSFWKRRAKCSSRAWLFQLGFLRVQEFFV
jgi:hypothetical protein